MDKNEKSSHSTIIQQKLNILTQKVSRFRQKVCLKCSNLPAEKSTKRSKKSIYNCVPTLYTFFIKWLLI
jgi:hypothetical protein